jgi:hypothetical protein
LEDDDAKGFNMLRNCYYTIFSFLRCWCELVFEPLILGAGDLINLDSQRGPMHSRIPGRKERSFPLLVPWRRRRKKKPVSLRELLN